MEVNLIFIFVILRRSDLCHGVVIKENNISKGKESDTFNFCKDRPKPQKSLRTFWNGLAAEFPGVSIHDHHNPCGSQARVLVIIQILIRQTSYQPTIDKEPITSGGLVYTFIFLYTLQVHG